MAVWHGALWFRQYQDKFAAFSGLAFYDYFPAVDFGNSFDDSQT